MNLQVKKRIDPGLFEAWSVCLSPADDVFASGSRNGAVNIWSMQEGMRGISRIPIFGRYFWW
jgi:WD40 repeat protein